MSGTFSYQQGLIYQQFGRGYLSLSSRLSDDGRLLHRSRSDFAEHCLPSIFCFAFCYPSFTSILQINGPALSLLFPAFSQAEVETKDLRKATRSQAPRPFLQTRLKFLSPLPSFPSLPPPPSPPKILPTPTLTLSKHTHLLTLTSAQLSFSLRSHETTCRRPLSPKHQVRDTNVRCTYMLD